MKKDRKTNETTDFKINKLNHKLMLLNILFYMI